MFWKRKTYMFHFAGYGGNHLAIIKAKDKYKAYKKFYRDFGKNNYIIISVLSVEDCLKGRDKNEFEEIANWNDCGNEK